MVEIHYNSERQGCIEVDPMKVPEQLIQDIKTINRDQVRVFSSRVGHTHAQE
jgi:hypothetical protein